VADWLDTSVLILAGEGPDEDAAISVVSLTYNAKDFQILAQEIALRTP
jgi:hypothetical protein